MTSGSEDRVPLTTVIAAYSNVSVLSKLGDTKDFGETICRLPDSDGFAWNPHNCFYTIACANAQAMVFMQVLALGAVGVGVGQNVQRRVNLEGLGHGFGGIPG